MNITHKDIKNGWQIECIRRLKMFYSAGLLPAFLFVILFATGFSGQAQTLTISSGGDTGTSGTNWSTSGTNPVTITATGNANIAPSVIYGYLSSNQDVVVEISTATGGDIIVSSAIATSGTATLSLYARRDISVNATISSIPGKLNIVLNPDSERNNDGAAILTQDITSNGGDVQIGSGTFTVGTVIGGSGTRNITTSGGAVSLYGDVLMSQSLNINSSGGDILFNGKVDSGNTYALSSTTYTDWNAAKTAAQTDVNHYLVTITSALENSLVRNTAAGVDVLIGGFADLSGNNYTWRWKTGPEGLMDSGNGMIFATSYNDGSSATHTLTPVAGAYNNWTAGEPNGNNAQAMQMWYHDGLAQWDNVPSTDTNTSRRYVQEISGSATTLTANAGSGNLTFSGEVGSQKALYTLNVTAATTAINGGGVTTNADGTHGGSGTQSYSGNITLGSAGTTLNMLDTPTDFVLASSKSISNATGLDATLTIKTTASIVMNTGSSILSSTGKLNTILWSDSDTNGGNISLSSASITTNGGHVWMGGGTQSGTTWNGLTVGNGYANSINTSSSSDGILILNTALNTGGGDIALHGKSAVGTNIAAGIRLNDEFSGSGSTIVNSGTGKITLDGIGQGSGGIAGVECNTGNKNATVLITSSNTSADAIVIVADAHLATASAWGLLSYYGTTISATGVGGGVTITGTNAVAGKAIGFYSHSQTGTQILGNGGPIVFNAITTGAGNSIYAEGTGMVVGQLAGSAVPTSSSNITINMDRSMAGPNSTIVPDLLFNTSGNLAVQPITAGTTIGIAGGAGTLQLASDLFSTNFAYGFNQITIGSAAQTGNITLNSVAFRDNMRLQTASAGKVIVNASQTVTLNAGVKLTVDQNLELGAGAKLVK